MSFWKDLLDRLRPKPVTPVPPRPVPVPPPAPVPPPPVPTPGDVAARLVDAHNAIRAGRGRPPFARSPRLEAAAAKHASLMAASKSMSHQLPGEASFDRRISAEGYQWSRAAENVAAGQASVAAVMVAWQNSPGHMANIVGPCTEMGGALAVGADGTKYWSVSFASPAGQFGVPAAPMLITTVFGASGTTSSIQAAPEGEDEP